MSHVTTVIFSMYDTPHTRIIGKYVEHKLSKIGPDKRAKTYSATTDIRVDDKKIS